MNQNHFLLFCHLVIKYLVCPKCELRKNQSLAKLWWMTWCIRQLAITRYGPVKNVSSCPLFTWAIS